MQSYTHRDLPVCYIGTVLCWDLRYAKFLNCVHVYGGGVRCLDFDGTSLLCGTQDGSVHLLDFAP